MEVKSSYPESALPQGGVERDPLPRVVVARRIDPNRPTRVWSLLLPPSFLDGGRKQPRTRAPKGG